jgi:serine/threonine protein kinase
MSQSFGKYQLEKKLATGGMAEVWLARQTGIEGFNRHVVIKRILPHLAEDPEFVQMFLNEAKIASRFNHPNIAQIYDLGEANGTYFIAMEFIHGEDLGRIMRRAWSTQQWVARPLVLRMIADTCQGLYYAHQRADEQGRPLNVVHRDISPQNILVSFDGTVKLVDFGIAKAADQVSNTKSGAIKGKFAYMAPEQAAGRPLDGRTDIFALGLVLYELLTGVRPLKRDSEIATLQAAMECAIEPPSHVAEVPPELDDVVMRAVAKSPDERYRDARQFQMALEQALVQEGTIATSVQVSELMETLFADRRAEEARLGAPNPMTESSTSNPAAAPQPEPKPEARPRPAPRSDDDSGETLAPDPQQVGGFELPSGTVVPSRRYATSTGRAPSRSDARGVDTRRRPSPVPTAHTAPELPRDLADADSPARRRNTGQLKKRSTSSVAMPEAPPPRKSKAVMPASRSDVSGSHTQLPPVDDRPKRSRAGLMLSGLVLVVAIIAGLLFKDRIGAALRRDGFDVDGVPVQLTVSTNPPSHVLVVPARGSKREPKDLGMTPLDRVSGAFVGDTVVLENLDRGIHYEETVEALKPNEPKLISKTFKEATLKIRTRPAIKGGALFRGVQKVGQANLPFKVFEGVQRLELRSDSLTQPVEFEVRLSPGEVLDKELDVTEALAK